MDSIAIVWIDRVHAKLFLLDSQSMERKEIHENPHEHHTHALENSDYVRSERKLFLLVHNEIRDFKKILIVGPGVAKHAFQNYLTEEHPARAKRVVACETMDQPTDAKIAELASRYFQVSEAV